jgi:hypothetical protein
MNAELLVSELTRTGGSGQLVGAGWSEQQALALAASREVDLHLACDLPEDGCDPDIALQILL